MRTETAVVEAIDAPTRTVTLKKPDGTVVVITAGPDIRRFEEIKVGDKINARVPRERRRPAVGSPARRKWTAGSRGTTGSDQVLPGGTKARQLTLTATIAAIDMNAPSVTFTRPNGWKHSRSPRATAAA